MQPSTLAKRVFILLFLAVIAFYLYGLGMLPLVGPDEPRYAQVAREMFLRGDPITPTLGGHTWFEKPALLYWMMMVAYTLFGVSEFSARLGPAICGLLTVLAVWLLVREIDRSTADDELHSSGRWSVLTLATSLGMIVFSRAASLDIVVTMTITWSLVFFALYELGVSPRNKKFLLAGFYGSIGLSLLAKGLIGLVIPLAVVALFFLVRRSNPPRDLITSLLWGLPLVLIVSATWYGPVIARHGWAFIDEFFIQHHFARYVSNKYKHPQPLYFYPAITILLTLPWTPFLVDSLLHIRSWKWRRADSVNRLRILAFCWMLFPIIFFSFSGSKLPGYILPVLPAVSILAGERITRFCANINSPKWVGITTGLVVIILAISGVSYAVVTGFRPLLALVLTLPLLIGGLVAIVFHKWRCNAMTLIAGMLLLTLTGVVQFVAYSRASRESVKELLRVADAQGFSNAPVFARRGSDRSAEFYASGRVVYDADGEPVELEEPPYLIAEARRRGERILVLVPVEYLEPYRRSPELIILAENGNLALIGVR